MYNKENLSYEVNRTAFTKLKSTVVPLLTTRASVDTK